MKNLYLLLMVLLLTSFTSLRAQTVVPAISDTGKLIRDNVATSLVKNLAKKSYKDAMKDFSNVTKDAITSDKLKIDWEKILVTYGDFDKILTTTSSEEKGYITIKKRCKFVKDNANVLITFNDDNKVIGLHFRP